MVIIKADKKCKQCGIKLDVSKRGLKFGRKYLKCPNCYEPVMTGKILYEDLTPKQKENFDEPYKKKLKTTGLIFLMAVVLSLMLPEKSAGLMAIIAFISAVYFIAIGVIFGSEKSQTIKYLYKDFNTDLLKKEKDLSKKMKKEGYKIVGETSEEDYYNDEEDEENEENEVDDEEFTCDNCGAAVKENAKKCPKCGVIFVEDEKDNDKDNEDDDSDEYEVVEKTKEKSNDSDVSVDDKFNSLVKLKELLDKEIITKEEFDKEKKKILGK